MGRFSNIADRIEQSLARLTGATTEETAQAAYDFDQARVDFVEQILEARQYVINNLALIEAEDHSVAPTQEDIDRYFDYHQRYLVRQATFANSGFWNAKEVAEMTKEEFDASAATGGWNFLRDAAGMPQGDLANLKAPWTSTATEWVSTRQFYGVDAWDADEATEAEGWDANEEEDMEEDN